MQLLLLQMILITTNAAFTTNLSSNQYAKAKLYDNFYKHQALTHRLSPLPSDGRLNVTFQYSLHQISEINEAKQTMGTISRSVLTWVDESLAWNPEDYADISLAEIPTEKIWHPNIFVVNSAQDDSGSLTEPPTVPVFSDGQIHYPISAITSTVCNFSLTFYPFDEQTCKIVFLPQAYDILLALNVSIEDDPATTYSSLNGEWAVKDLSISAVDVSSDGFNFQAVEVTVFMKRHHIYYIFCVIMPMQCTSMLMLLVFWIPPASGDKMCFLISVFVSMTLLLNNVGSTLPRKMADIKSIPRMTIYLVFTFVQCVGVMMATAFVLRRHQEEEEIKGLNITGTDNSAEKDQLNEQDGFRGDCDKKTSTLSCCKIFRGIPSWKAGEADAMMVELRQSQSVQSVDGPKSIQSLTKCQKKWKSSSLDMMFFWVLVVIDALFYIWQGLFS